MAVTPESETEQASTQPHRVGLPEHSWSQKRNTSYLCFLRKSLRASSFFTSEACCPPSSSTIKRCSRQQKLAINGPTLNAARRLARSVLILNRSLRSLCARRRLLSSLRLRLR